MLAANMYSGYIIEIVWSLVLFCPVIWDELKYDFGFQNRVPLVQSYLAVEIMTNLNKADIYFPDVSSAL